MRSTAWWLVAGVAIYLLAKNYHLVGGVFEIMKHGVTVAALTCLAVWFLFRIPEAEFAAENGGRGSCWAPLLGVVVILFILWLGGAI